MHTDTFSQPRAAEARQPLWEENEAEVPEDEDKGEGQRRVEFESPLALSLRTRHPG